MGRIDGRYGVDVSRAKLRQPRKNPIAVFRNDDGVGISGRSGGVQISCDKVDETCGTQSDKAVFHSLRRSVDSDRVYVKRHHYPYVYAVYLLLLQKRRHRSRAVSCDGICCGEHVFNVFHNRQSDEHIPCGIISHDLFRLSESNGVADDIRRSLRPSRAVLIVQKSV